MAPSTATTFQDAYYALSCAVSSIATIIPLHAALLSELVSSLARHREPLAAISDQWNGVGGRVCTMEGDDGSSSYEGCVVCDLLLVVCGLWHVVYGMCRVGCGVWVVGCGLWVVGNGLWVVGCGLWVVACGLWLGAWS